MHVPIICAGSASAAAIAAPVRRNGSVPRPAGRTGRWTIALLALALLAPAQRAAFDSAAVVKQIRTADPNDLQRVLGAISADDAKLLTRELLRNVEGPDAYKFLAAITVLLLCLQLKRCCQLNFALSTF